MSTTFRKMDAQLKTWLDKIERLAGPGSRVDAPTQRIDELRALHAAALKEYTGFRAADADGRVSLKPRTVLAWNALAAALRSPKPASS